MAKEIKQPQSKLRDNEKVIYSTSAQTSGFIIMGEGGYLYLTNKRLFMEKIGTGDVRYSFELNVIDDCRSGISINLFLLPFLPLILIGGLKCAKLYDKNGIAIKKLSVGLGGFGSKKLITPSTYYLYTVIIGYIARGRLSFKGLFRNLCNTILAFCPIKSLIFRPMGA